MKNIYSVSVGTSSTPIAPAMRGFTAVDAVDSTVYSAGDYVTMANGRTYWTPDGGTYTDANAPTHTRGVATSADSITWYLIPDSISDVVVSLDDSADSVYLGKGSDAVESEGFKLDSSIAARSFGDYTGAINGIVASGTATVIVEIV